jgi:hypothetical protein
MKNILLLFLSYMMLFSVRAQEEVFTNKFTKDLQFSGQWFLSYTYRELPAETYNAFTIKRGYFSFKKIFNEYLSLRFTQDITLDEEGDDAGNLEMRFKYCYLKLNNTYLNFLKSTFFEFGLVHRPWLDFEQKINPYRVQGRMFLERFDIVSSADFGVLFGGLIGGEIEEEKMKISAQKGKFGSYSLGVFNGGGYDALEYNSNKIVETRISLRPFPEYIPGLQFSFNAGYGKGNSPESPDFDFRHFCVSFENSFLVLSTQFSDGLGSHSGNYVDTNFKAFNVDGYSFFAEYKTPLKNTALFARYDQLRVHDASIHKYEVSIIGLAYCFLNNSKLIFDIDHARKGSAHSWIYEVALDVVF